MAIYINDFDFYYPQYQGLTGAATDPRWSGLLWQHGVFTSGLTFTCPQLDFTFPLPGIQHYSTLSPTLPPHAGAFTHVHYAYNYLHIGSSNRALGGSNPSWRRPARDGEIAKPSETYLALDGVTYSLLPNDRRGYFIAHDFNYDLTGPHARHGQGTAINALWVDGHSSAVAPGGELVRGVGYPAGLTKVTDANNYWDRD